MSNLQTSPITNSTISPKNNSLIQPKNNSTISAKNHQIVFNDLVSISLELKNRLLLLHWNTKHYSTHIATNEIYNDVHSIIDRLVETYMGSLKEEDFFVLQKPTNVVAVNKQANENITSLTDLVSKVIINIYEFKKTLNLDESVKNILDEYAGILNRFKYLIKIK